MNNNSEGFFKIVLIGLKIYSGDSGVGKSNLLTRFTKNEYAPDTKTTIGVEFSQKIVRLEGKDLKVQVWDTAGQERYHAITTTYYKGAVGALLVYDITKLSSFRSLSRWIEEIREYADPHIVILLVGNKSDMKHIRAVKSEEVTRFAEENNLAYIETSAKDSFNVESAFNRLVFEINFLINKKSAASNADGLFDGKMKLNSSNPKKKGECCS